MNLKKCAILFAGVALAMPLPALASSTDDVVALLPAPTAPAAPTAHAEGGATEPAAHGGRSDGGTENAKPARGSATENSSLTSTGSFVPPEMKIVQRAPFGSKAGKAEEFDEVETAAQDSGLFFNIFAGASALALALTAGIAFSLSRTTKADGSPGRAFTLGAKLACGFGTVVTGILVLSMLSSRASGTVSNAMAESEHLSAQDSLIAQMNGNMLATRLSAKGFLITNSDEDLVKFSDASASFARKLELAKATIRNPERVKMVESIDANIDEYERKFTEVVKLIDERNSVVDIQMLQTGMRATALLEEIANTARADGDAEAGFAAASTNEHFQLARLSFFKYLRKGDTKFADEAIKSAEETKRELAALESQIQNQRRKAWLKEAGEAITFWVARMQHAEKLQEKRNELVINGMDKIGPQIAKTSAELIASLGKSKEEIAEKANATTAAAKIQTATLSGVIALAGACLALFIARGIIRGLKMLESRLKDISEGEGDLTKRVEIKSRDEIGLVAQWFNVFVSKIERTICEVKAGAAQIDAGGSQIAQASQSLAQGASEQASSLQQISASIEEMSGQTQQSAENARQASALAEENKKSADRGQAEMVQMSKAVNEIKQSSAEISKIIKVIDEIAFQTNLLALNAAVEAARAGEAGKGFAVVAEEVRNLAQRSAEAAKNTSAMIEESVKRSENGVQIATRVGQALEEITTSTNKVNTLLSEIASASSEQATGIGQVNQGVSQLDQVTQQNAGNSEELASSAEEMSSQVASLNELVAQFKVSGGNPAASRPAGQVPQAKAAAPSQPARSPIKALKAAAAKGKASQAKTAQAKAEQVIPMEDNEVLASF